MNLRWTSLNALLIVSARFVSDFGAFLNMVALSTYVYLLSNNVMHVSIFLACRVAGGIIAMTGFGIGMLLVAPFYIWLPPSIVILVFHGLPLTVLVLVLLWVRRFTTSK
ncbi:hypothetical protein [Xenorhabdus thuongxuanensis]|uniref:hypothetical protein n=1 Tax=Xenorhabdus thuongxuanensis TaxID=1873484 RepID=UPI0039EFB28F